MGLAIMTKYVNWNEVPLTLDMQQVADILNVHINTVKNMIARNDLPSFKIGRSVRINKIDLQKYMGVDPDEVE